MHADHTKNGIFQKKFALTCDSLQSFCEVHFIKKRFALLIQEIWSLNYFSLNFGNCLNSRVDNGSISAIDYKPDIFKFLFSQNCDWFERFFLRHFIEKELRYRGAKYKIQAIFCRLLAID